MYCDDSPSVPKTHGWFYWDAGLRLVRMCSWCKRVQVVQRRSNSD